MSEALRTLTVQVPMTIRRRGGRKVVITPDGAPAFLPREHRSGNADPTLIKALARAFRWKRMLDNGRYASISEIAIAEKN